MSGWQPIETAPRDGTVVLVFSPDAGDPKIILAWFLEFEGDPDPGGWYDFWNDGRAQIDVGITHWMPLPPPPGSAPTTPIARRLRAIANEMPDRALAALISGVAMEVGRLEERAERVAERICTEGLPE